MPQFQWQVTNAGHSESACFNQACWTYLGRHFLNRDTHLEWNASIVIQFFVRNCLPALGERFHVSFSLSAHKLYKTSIRSQQPNITSRMASVLFQLLHGHSGLKAPHPSAVFTYYDTPLPRPSCRAKVGCIDGGWVLKYGHAKPIRTMSRHGSKRI